MAREIEPGTSSMGEEQPRVMLPMQIAPEEVVLVPREGRCPDPMDQEQREESNERPTTSEERGSAKRQPPSNTVPAADISDGAQWLEQLADRYRAML